MPDSPSKVIENPASRVTVIATVLNEEIHITRCLNALRWAREVFVVDGGSTDGTVQLAKAAGAYVFSNEWQGYSQQKNWALANLPIKTDWVLFLDADEVVTPELAIEIEDVTLDSANVVAWYVNRRMVFLGRWLKHVWWYPDRVLRLVRIRLGGRFEDRAVHERWLVAGDLRELKNDLIHENLKPLEDYLERLNRYSSLEAQEMLAERSKDAGTQIIPRLTGDWVARRRALKISVWNRLPLRPFIRLFWMQIIKGGWRDGREGWIFTKLHVIYEMQINIKLSELSRFPSSAIVKSAHTPR